MRLRVPDFVSGALRGERRIDVVLVWGGISVAVGLILRRCVEGLDSVGEQTSVMVFQIRPM
jgi:hypothetical protein